MVSLPRGCALAAIALAPASLLFSAFEIMFGQHICREKLANSSFTSNISHKLSGE